MKMKNKTKTILTGAVIGAVALVALTLIVVAIAASANGLSMSEQVVTWFGGTVTPPAVDAPIVDVPVTE